jgi:hypothetical protein
MSIDKVMGETGLGEALEDAPVAGATDLAALGVIAMNCTARGPDYESAENGYLPGRTPEAPDPLN